MKILPEKSAWQTGMGVALTFVVGLTFTMLLPSFNENWSLNTLNPAGDQAHYHQPYTAQQLHGRLIYQREGCVYCHTQQIRPLEGEIKRYSIGTSLALPSNEREYVYDRPHFLGTRRIGPDLSREGGKYSDDWQYSHFYYPRQMVPGSIMPAFTWLFKDNEGTPVPTQEARDLVAYVQTLGFEREVYDPATYNASNGHDDGWGPWLKPQDRQASQQLGENAVNRITAGPDHGTVRGGTEKTPADITTKPGMAPTGPAAPTPTGPATTP
ncbi:MAG: cbb3-type cytochrome c oxidase subunit II [Capsulimonas sp.]|uniref:cbb3-type cytochrome c oxidase subunit II n=1 Tax=Capsulimonas sp. TaxID=2494211 RepID=UPI0032654591